MKGITTVIVLVGLLVIGLLVGVPVMDTLAPMVENMTPQFADQVGLIHAVTVKWLVPIFAGAVILWAVFWILRQERQQV